MDSSSSTLWKSDCTHDSRNDPNDRISNRSTLPTELGYCVSVLDTDCKADNEVQLRDTHLDEVTKQLRRCITGKQDVSGIQLRCWSAYLVYLHHCIGLIWAPIIMPVAIGLGPNTQADSIAGRTVTYKMLVQVKQYLRQVRQHNLPDLVASLRDKSLVNNGSEQLAQQMGFLFVGWLTALFDPLPNAPSHILAIKGKEEKSPRRQIFCRPVIRNTEVGAAVGIQPLCRLLSRFGILLPQPELDSETTASRDVEVGGDCIDTALISFQKLQETLKMKIEWVQTINQHLEFDQQVNTLRLFRFPSLLWLMYQHKEDPLLTRLCEDNRRELSPDDGLTHSRIHPTEVILVEIIISYHLIFGRNWRSRRRIGSILDKQRKMSIEHGFHDPLLESLCSKDRRCDELREIYIGLDEDETKFGPFVPAEEFPFLGRRLIQLQRLSIGQNPRSLRRLWNDTGSYHAIRTAVIFGAGAMVLAILQLCFQIWPIH